MTSTYDDSVINFDLDFLNQTSKITCLSKLEKQRKAILIAKQKTITTDSLIKKYYSKKEALEQTERTLYASKEECKQVCIDYKDVLEKCERLENEIQAIQHHKQQLQQKISEAENQCCGIRSHARQLEVLVKEQETQIESLKIENHLEKSNIKNYATSTSNLQKQNELLLQDLCILGKLLIGNKKLKPEHKTILQKYEKYFKQDDDSCNDSRGGHNYNELDTFEDNYISPQRPHGLERGKQKIVSLSEEVQDVIVVNILSQGKHDAPTCKPDEIDRLSYCSNDVASADTGRGSSLAFSDSDKCFRSPDYFSNDHIREIISKPIINVNSVGTSPIRDIQTVDIATSPMRFETSTVPTITIDQALSSVEPIIEPIIIENDQNVTEINCTATMIDESVHEDANDQVTNLQEEQCLQVNNSNHYNDENSRDCEIEMILSKMQFNHELITPIPCTPFNSRNAVVSKVSGCQTSHNDFIICRDAAKLMDENKILHASIAELAKEIGNIKSLLKLNPLALVERSPTQEKVSNLKHLPSESSSESSKHMLCKSVNAEENVEETLIEDVEETLIEDVEEALIEDVEEALVERNPTPEKVSNLKDLPSESSSESSEHMLCKIINAEENVKETSIEQNEIELVERSPTPEKVSNLKDLASESSSKLCKSKNAEENVKATLIEQNENNENNDLIEMVDLVQVCDSENFESDDFTNLNCQEFVHIIEDTSSFTQSALQEYPLINIEEQESPERMLGRLEFEQDRSASPIQSPSKNLNDANPNTPKSNTERNTPVEEILNSNERDKRRMRLNKLEKLRRKMIPKCKIRREIESKRKPLFNKQIGKSTRQVQVNEPSKKVTSADSSASLNDKTVYDKAVKVMSELKSKWVEIPKQNKTPKKVGYMTPVKVNKTFENSRIKSCSKSIKDLFDTPILNRKSTDKPFRISDLMSKQTPIPTIKNVVVAQETHKSIGLTKQQNKQISNSIVLVNKIIEIPGKKESKCAKTVKSDNNLSPQSLSPSVTTRSRRRIIEKPQILNLDLLTEVECATNEKQEIYSKESRKRRRRLTSDDKPEVAPKRILRSSTRRSNTDEIINTKVSLNNNTIPASNNDNNTLKSLKVDISVKNDTRLPLNNANKKAEHKSSVSYHDLDMFNDHATNEFKNSHHVDEIARIDPKHSILCTMLDKYSLYKTNLQPKKISDGITHKICELIEKSIKEINELSPSETKLAMNRLVENIQFWNMKQFLAGFMKYLQDPQRKIELFSKVNSPPAPPMTKSEQVLIFVIIQLKNIWLNVDVETCILSNIEYVMFKLNRTPDFDTIESMAHFYAVLCRYFKMKTRLRLFMLDAMYCMQYKAIVLIRQCMDVWMHILPLAHMGIAKNPLVTCVVYLLHFYKCEDYFKRVQDIRYILSRKYSYEMTEWNETRILDMVRNAVCEVKEIPAEKKMLRLSLIILAKRHGARWCQKNIITNLLQPIIQKNDSPDIVKRFCVSMIGPLMKPYPIDMKVHCEVIMNLLLNMLKQNPSPLMKEAIFTSLIYMSKQNQNRVISALLSWHPKQVSSECQDVLRDFVREKPAHAWKSILSRINLYGETLY